MKKLYFIGGTMGVGKTTISQSLKKKLSNSIFLDGDWCWDAEPFQVTEETKHMVMDNICHLLNNSIHCTAYDHIIFCWVMHKQSIIDTILNNLDITNCEVKTISLIADETSIKNRISIDISKGIRREDALERSLARMPLYFSMNTIKIDTSNKTVEEVVSEIEKL